MLTEFFVNILSNVVPSDRKSVKCDRPIAEEDLSPHQRKALRGGNLHELRNLLQMEATNNPDTVRLGSEYEVFHSPTTPHCQTFHNQRGVIDESYWKISEPIKVSDSANLTIVGTGIRGGLQTTPEARLCIQRCPRVLYLVSDLVTKNWIEALNPNAESLHSFYEKGKERMEIYNAIIDKILAEVRDTKNVCVVFYGHPGIFVYPARDAMRRARKEGLTARMLPAISADANLYSDLGVDPGIVGMQSYEATGFLINQYKFDPHAGLVLWQIGVLGQTKWEPFEKVRPEYLQLLVDYLQKFYEPSHEVVIYEAPELPYANPVIDRVQLCKVPAVNIPGIATLYIPPKAPPKPDFKIAEKLGIQF